MSEGGTDEYSNDFPAEDTVRDIIKNQNKNNPSEITVNGDKEKKSIFIFLIILEEKKFIAIEPDVRNSEQMTLSQPDCKKFFIFPLINHS